MATEIRIGTASWTDPGFVEDWYPRKLPAGDRLRWYAEHFNYVEVNSTFYAIPDMRMVDRWCTQTPRGFMFDVKLPKLLSRHVMPVKFLPTDLRGSLPVKGANALLTPESEELVAQRVLRELQPLFYTKKFGAFLLQLSPSFRPKANRLEELDRLRELLKPHRLAVELRNRDWVTGPELSKTLAYFTERAVTFVLVDAPQSEHFTVMPGLNHVTNPELGYFRYHGRNETGYITGRSVAERFDHEYTEEETEELIQRARDVAVNVNELHLVANNNRSNFAPKLAQKLQAALAPALRKAPEEEQANLF